jgi:hypothetical protein
VIEVEPTASLQETIAVDRFRVSYPFPIATGVVVWAGTHAWKDLDTQDKFEKADTADFDKGIGPTLATAPAGPKPSSTGQT